MRKIWHLAALVGTLAVVLTLSAESHADARDDARAAISREDYQAALPILLSLGGQGDIRAQAVVGWLYASGKITNGSSSIGVAIIREAADKGDPYAQFFVGTLLATSPENYSGAAEWLRLAAEQGLAPAQSSLGMMYFVGRGVREDHAEALTWLRLGAEQGDASGQYALGLAYERGNGVAKDRREALVWYRRAAEQGDAAAQGRLAVAYFRGEDVLQDYEAAAMWARRAAAQGDAIGQVVLGSLYGIGAGVPEDDVQAYFWLNIGVPSLQDEEIRARSASQRDLIAQNLSRRQLAEAQRLAREWKPTPETPVGSIWLRALSDRR